MKWIKLLGLLLDITGTIIIGIAVINLNRNLRHPKSLDKPEEEINEEIRNETVLTVIGIVLIFVGFLLIFGEELYFSYILKRQCCASIKKK
jgi:hypothetical protein